MRIGLAGAPLLAVLLAAAPASAEELQTRFEAGVRAGMGVPIGNAVGARQGASGGTSLADLVSWKAPLQLDLGARIGPVFVGGYVAYAFGKTGGAFDSANAHSVNDVRFGFEVLWHFAQDRKVDPWVGIGVGYEWLNLSVTGTTGTTAHATLRGFEWVNAQAGVDFVLGRNFRLGPFLQANIAQYDTGSLDIFNIQGAGGGGSSDLPSKTVHAWIDVGLRFAFLL